MKRDEFIWAKHHLQHKSYSNILTNLEKVNELIGNLNIKLKNLEEHMDNKIDTQYRDGLSHYLGDIVQSVFYNDTEVDYIKIKEVKENEIHILRNETECIKIPCIFGVEKTKEVISNIIEQLEFKKRLLEIQNINNELKKDFWEPFEKFLKLILDNYERKSKLKGRCEECSRLYKYFDC
ncbi:MAG: hypothetical protein MUO82_07300 [Candidatus Thermoplasmatota archaeon]|nr:hypothetical protein [Candidatus Thermoplasmatota archaeon]